MKDSGVCGISTCLRAPGKFIWGSGVGSLGLGPGGRDPLKRSKNQGFWGLRSMSRGVWVRGSLFIIPYSLFLIHWVRDPIKINKIKDFVVGSLMFRGV